MKAVFKVEQHQNINPKHRRHDRDFKGQLVAIDCDKKKEIILINLYKRHQVYYCCLWINGDELCVTGSGTGETRLEAVYTALESASVSFDEGLPEVENCLDVFVWSNLSRFIEAIAQAAGSENYYIHNSD